MSIRDQLINMGHAAGQAAGHTEAAHRFAINLLKDEGLTPEKIAKVSELPLAEVLKLKEELTKKH